jgi:predicted membrane metal-binding protein
MDLNLIISGFLIGLVITIFGMIFRIENFSFKDNLKRTAKEIVLFIALYLVMIFLLNLL